MKGWRPDAKVQGRVAWRFGAGAFGIVALAAAMQASAYAQGIKVVAPAQASVDINVASAVPDAGAVVSAMVLGIGQEVSGSTSAAAKRRYRVDVPSGYVVQGQFQGLGVALDLHDAQGRHIRRLAAADVSSYAFSWVRGSGQEYLVVHSQQGQAKHFELHLTRALAPVRPDNPDDLAGPLRSVRMRSLQTALARGGSTDAFWKERAAEGTPLIEPLDAKQSLVTFLWRGNNESVRLFGSPSGNHDPLKRLGDSDVWYASYAMPNTARLSYRLAPDVPLIEGSSMDQRRAILATAQRDPLNPRVYPALASTTIDVYQGRSVVELPQAPPQPWITPRPQVEPGRLIHHRYRSELLGNERDVWIYRPADAAPEALLVVFDAHAYLKEVPTPTTIDNLMADGLIPPTAVVLIGNPSPEIRGRELPPNASFAAFLDRELMPWVGAQGLAQPARLTVVAGSSYGGLASAYAGLVNRQWFGNVLSLSGSYWWAPEGKKPGWMMREYASAEKSDLRFYIDAGRYEAARGGRDGILETSRHLGDVLRAKGYEVTQVEHDTGHDYLHWQGSLGCGLVALLNPARYAQGLKACAKG